MGRVRQLVVSLRERAAKQEEELLAIVKKHEPELLDLNKEQLQGNQDSDGKSLGKYSKKYAELKGEENVNLFLTGDFYYGFFFASEKFPVIIFSYDEKTEWLVNRYGENVFGLTKNNKLLAASTILKDDIAAYYKKLLSP